MTLIRVPVGPQRLVEIEDPMAFQKAVETHGGLVQVVVQIRDETGRWEDGPVIWEGDYSDQVPLIGKRMAIAYGLREGARFVRGVVRAPI